MERLEERSEAEQHAILALLVRRLDETLRDMGFEVPPFALVLCHDLRGCRYVANCNHTIVISALRETADWLERQAMTGADTPAPSIKR